MQHLQSVYSCCFFLILQLEDGFVLFCFVFISSFLSVFTCPHRCKRRWWWEEQRSADPPPPLLPRPWLCFLAASSPATSATGSWSWRGNRSPQWPPAPSDAGRCRVLPPMRLLLGGSRRADSAGWGRPRQRVWCIPERCWCTGELWTQPRPCSWSAWLIEGLRDTHMKTNHRWNSSRQMSVIINRNIAVLESFKWKICVFTLSEWILLTVLKSFLTFFLISDTKWRQAPVQLVLGCGSRWSWDQSIRETDLLTGSKFSCSHKECVTFISLPGEEKPRAERQHALICTRHGVKDLILPFITDGVIGGTTLRLVPGLTAGLQSRVQAPAGSWQQRRGSTCVLGL